MPSFRRPSRSVSVALAVTLFLFVAVAAVAIASPWRPPAAIELQALADGVWVALQPAAGRFDDSNSLIIAGSDGVTVVDAQASPEFVQATIAAIARMTDLPVTRVINTHWHSDHTQGNALYLAAFPEVELLGHASLLEDVPGRAAADITERVAYFERELPGARERLEAGIFRDGSPMSEDDRAEQGVVIAGAEAWLEANRDVRFAAPNRTYEDRLSLQVGSRTVELIHVRAHTRGDTFVWLPQEGILATGDVVDDLPFVGHGYPAEWAAALDQTLKLPIRTVVPGHGPVFEGLEQIAVVRGFIGALVQQVKAAVDGGKDLEATTAAVDLSEWRTRLSRDEEGAGFFDAVLPAAIERAWLEARNELPD